MLKTIPFLLFSVGFAGLPAVSRAANVGTESFDLKVIAGADGAFAFYTDNSWHVAPNLKEVSPTMEHEQVLYSHGFRSSDEVLGGRKSKGGQCVYTDRRLQLFPCGAEHWMTAHRTFQSSMASTWDVSVWEWRGERSKMLSAEEAERYLATFGVSPGMAVIGSVDGRVYYVPSRDSDKVDISVIYWKDNVSHVEGDVPLPARMGEIDGVMVDRDGYLCVAGWMKIPFREKVKTMGFAGGVNPGVLRLSLKCSRPNQALEPTRPTVTPFACAKVAPVGRVAHL